MLELFASALAMPGLWLVVFACVLAGIVYGFAGFGSALIFMPLASRVVPPEVAVGAFSLSALASLFTVVPGAWKVCDRPGVTRMILAAVVLTPLGVWILRVAETELLRTGIAVLALVTLVLLVSGFRMPVAPGPRSQIAIGAASGVTGGATGLNGPVVILFNMGAGLRAEQVRANTAVFLTVSSLTFLPQLWVQGLMPATTLALGALLLPVYAAATWLGARLFSPGRETLYRYVAYLIIAAAGLAGLPVWG